MIAKIILDALFWLFKVFIALVEWLPEATFPYDLEQAMFSFGAYIHSMDVLFDTNAFIYGLLFFVGALVFVGVVRFVRFVKQLMPIIG